MVYDAQGQPLTGATAAAAHHYDRAVRAYALSYGDTLAALDAALRDAPNLTMAVLFKAWVMVLANDVPMAAKARPVIAAAREMEQGERERAHLAALAHAVEGHRHSATAVLDRYLLVAPHDLLAHAAAMFLDAFQGRFHRVRDRSARALPLWSKDQPGYGLLLAYYGFGLEEAAGNSWRGERPTLAGSCRHLERPRRRTTLSLRRHPCGYDADPRRSDVRTPNTQVTDARDRQRRQRLRRSLS